ncbi:sortase family protein [Rhodococcus sp. AG1013]|nr:sortase family protein [Rhodococcus sp. AG1013]
MTDRSTGRCPRSRRNGLSAAVAACATAALVLAGCASTEPGNEQVSATTQSATTPATGAGANLADPSALHPVSISIPAIGVTSDLMMLGLEPDGALEVPPGGHPAGWYSGSPVPGEIGPAIVAGHVDWEGDPGVFYRLHELTPGDEVTATRSDGVTAVFRVASVERFAKASFPTSRVYGDLDHPGLRLITCGGEFDDSVRSYRDNTVVFADLIDQRDSISDAR